MYDDVMGYSLYLIWHVIENKIYSLNLGVHTDGVKLKIDEALYKNSYRLLLLKYV